MENSTSELDKIVRALEAVDAQIKLVCKGMPIGGAPYLAGLSFDYARAEATLCRIQQNLRDLHNKRAPVMRLPPEVLGAILRTAQLSEPPFARTPIDRFLGSFSYSTYYKWLIRLTHVCHYWREVASSCGVLWTSFWVIYEKERKSVPDPLGRAALFFKNSAKRLLDVHLHGDGGRPPPIAADIFSQLPRIRSLHFQGRLSAQDEEFLTDHSAPLLEVLVLVVDSLSLPMLPSPDTWAEMPTLFNGHCPRLRSLRLGHFVDGGANSFQMLRQLHLTEQHLTVLEDIDGLFDLIRDIPNLEDLAFEHLDVEEDIMDHLMFRNLGYLPRLKRLAFFQTETAKVAVILNLFDFREDQDVCITLDACLQEDMSMWRNMHIAEELVARFKDLQIHCSSESLYSLQATWEESALQFVNYNFESDDLCAALSFDFAMSIRRLWLRLAKFDPAMNVDPLDFALLFSVLALSEESTVFIEANGTVIRKVLRMFKREEFWTAEDRPPKDIHLALTPYLHDRDSKFSTPAVVLRELKKIVKDLSARRTPAHLDFHLYVPPSGPGLDELQADNPLLHYQQPAGFKSITIHSANAFPVFLVPPVCTQESSSEWEWPRWTI